MRIILLFFMVIFLNADNLEITKYVTNEKPKIVVEYVNITNDINKLLTIDSKLISNYQLDINRSVKSLTSPINMKKYKKYNYLLRIDYKNKNLKALLYDLVNKKVILYKKYKIPSYKLYPFSVHYLSYDINNKLGFKPVKWITKKIVYSVHIAPKENSIFISDITLHYRKKIISGGLNIFPKWADDKQTTIYYTKLEASPVLYKYNIFTGQKQRIFASEGMLIVSDVKGDNLLLTLAINDQPDIYEYNLKNKKLKRLTTYQGIDVNGQFYQNGIIFISDRLGYPNVYYKDLTTGSVSKVLYHGRNHISVTAHNDDIVVSSRETNKAFSKNTFNLLLVNKNSDIVKRLTFGGKNMMPVFSEDGSTILFIKEYRFDSKLGILRLDKNKIFYFKINRKMQSFSY